MKAEHSKILRKIIEKLEPSILCEIALGEYSM